MCALLTYGGVSLFVVVFAVYPFAAEMFRRGDIPKRLIPGTIALGAFTFTMDSLPGTPQIQNIIPTTFFGTDTWAAPLLGVIGGAFILALRTRLSRLATPRWRCARGEGYGAGHSNEPEQVATDELVHPLLAVAAAGRRRRGEPVCSRARFRASIRRSSKRSSPGSRSRS